MRERLQMKSLVESKQIPNQENTRLLVLWTLFQVVYKGQSLNTLLPQLKKKQSIQDYGFCAELANGVCRQFFVLEGLCQLLLSKKLKKKDQDILLLIYLGLYQLEYTQVAPHAALSETVNLTRNLSKPWATKLVNAILRRFQREKQTLFSQLKQAQWALAPWMLKKIQIQWQKEWQAIALAYQQKPPMILRVDLTQVTRPDFINILEKQGIDAKVSSLVKTGVELAQPIAVTQLPYFDTAGCSVQDAGAQLATLILDPQENETILDACAAPGGKTLHLLQTAKKIKLTAIDHSQSRLIKIKANLQRAHLSAEIIHADATKPEGAWAERQYDRILLDVPCSASGVIRRHPDIKLLRTPADIQKLTRLQAQILAKMWPCLKKGGHLLYMTCSIFAEENEQQIASFLTQYPDAKALEMEFKWGIKRSFGRQLLPIEKTNDGFYFMLIKKLNA